MSKPRAPRPVERIPKGVRVVTSGKVRKTDRVCWSGDYYSMAVTPEASVGKSVATLRAQYPKFFCFRKVRAPKRGRRSK